MITSMDQLVAALPAAQILTIYKNSVTSEGANFYHSLWRVSGNPLPGNLPVTESGEVVTSATLGACSFANAQPGDTLYIAKSVFGSSHVGITLLVDRLVQTSGLSGTNVALQAVNTVALTRSVSGQGVQMGIEWYTATGSTARNLTVNYTNQDNVPKSTVLYVLGSPTAGQLTPIPFAEGDYGVRSVQSVQWDLSTGTVGDFGITLYKPLTSFPITSTYTNLNMDAITSGLPKIEDNAALAFIVLCTSSSTGTCLGQYHIISG